MRRIGSIVMRQDYSDRPYNAYFIENGNLMLKDRNGIVRVIERDHVFKQQEKLRSWLDRVFDVMAWRMDVR